MSSIDTKLAVEVLSKNPNLLGIYFVWWFGDFPKQIKTIIIASLKRIYHTFSLPYLVRTLFAPWKRDIEEVINPSIQDKVKVAVDNLISRFLGAVVRMATILAGIVVLSLATIISILSIIIWYLHPILIIFFLCYGIYLL